MLLSKQPWGEKTIASRETMQNSRSKKENDTKEVEHPKSQLRRSSCGHQQPDDPWRQPLVELAGAAPERREATDKARGTGAWFIPTALKMALGEGDPWRSPCICLDKQAMV